MEITRHIKKLPGPILVLGAGGFVGANLFRMLYSVRDDVYAGVYSLANWRLNGIPPDHIVHTNLLDKIGMRNIFESLEPQVIFHTVAYGAYSFEKDWQKIHQTNYLALLDLLELMLERGVKAFVHSGSSSEYGLNASGPKEDTRPIPNSHYAVSKVGAAAALSYYGEILGLPVVNLRLYSVYGPYEDSSRLIPVLVRKALKGSYPPLANPETSRDYIYVDDVSCAFIRAALEAEKTGVKGQSFNIGTGKKTTLRELADVARGLFSIENMPEFGDYPQRAWDVAEWYANPDAAQKKLNWKAETDLESGLNKTAFWQNNLENPEEYWGSSKQASSQDRRRSIAAIIAIYKDALAIPIMYKRLRDTFKKIDVDYKIVFVNDCSPDDSEEVIRSISASDADVIGISHARNFGSQMAFRSGMEIIDTDACVLLDGDLQDPPEIIEQFYLKWIDGYDVIYGERIKREMNPLAEKAYKFFYWFFDKMSDFSVPRNAGDFSLIDRRVYRVLLAAPERDLFLRGLRAYVGFKQTGVPYIRPERAFGVSTNNWMKNFGWAKKAVFAYSQRPLNIMTSFGIGLFALSIFFLLYLVIGSIIDPTIPRGIPTTIALVAFFGAVNMLGIATLGEYIGKIITEVKERPRFVRRNLIQDGIIKHDLDLKLQLSKSIEKKV